MRCTSVQGNDKDSSPIYTKNSCNSLSKNKQPIKKLAKGLNKTQMAKRHRKRCSASLQFSSVQFSCLVMSDSL